MSESDLKDILMSSYELSISVVFPQENPLCFGPNVSNSGLQCKKVKKVLNFFEDVVIAVASDVVVVAVGVVVVAASYFCLLDRSLPL